MLNRKFTTFNSRTNHSRDVGNNLKQTTEMDKEQIFINQSIYPNAADVFNIDIKPIEEILNDCLFVVDTNALLIPYTTSSSGFEEIKKAYSKLIKKKQLIIPGQVAREFAKNRPEKIKTLFQQLNRIRDKIQKLSTGQYPLLETLQEYKEAVELEKEIQVIQNKYSKKIGEILGQIKNWRWNDPVSSVYNELFSEKVIHELEIDQDEILKELERRNKFSIPPGFKDKSKDDFGVGDLLIWLSILEVAKEHKKDVIFISGDEKNDWFHRSESQSLYPRFELITEFKHKTNGKSFHIIKLSQLLTKLGADEKAVKEVEVREKNVSISFSEYRNFSIKAEELVHKWLQETESEKEIIANRGFPDFMIKDSEKIEGIDVMTIRDRKQFMPLHRFQERYMRAYYEINEGEYDCFRIIIVVQNRDAIDSVNKYFSRFSDKYKNEFITIMTGIISDDGNFEQI